MDSVWTANDVLPRFPAMTQDINTDTLVIGGGMAGILCAHTLHTAGVDTVLVEANRIGSGITKNTTAKITAQHGLIYHKLLTPTAKRCPHLGCALKWNPQEHTWDCPCHGSRFTEGGQLLDGPATGDLKE